MTYEETIEFLFNQLAMYQRVGAVAYKPGLDTALKLDAMFGNPSKKLRCIHIAGTNGKGSTAHTLAAVLQSAGYKTGLYTSPHLVDFRERIRINGEKIDKESVVDFTRRFLERNVDIRPSFFELTMVMAFEYFAKNNVDIAVIETGLGGRLDSTNIITPVLSVITNISFDHVAMLGNTLEAIATEKAGIIKQAVPVVIGEATGDVRQVFIDKAKSCDAPIRFACDEDIIEATVASSTGQDYETSGFGRIHGELKGDWQAKNAATILTSIDELRRSGLKIPDEAVGEGFSRVCDLTGLAGRWMLISDRPMTVCDTGHNTGGWEYLVREIVKTGRKKRIVAGFANDKEISGILKMIAGIGNMKFYAAEASVERALASSILKDKAIAAGIDAEDGGRVSEAYRKALADAGDDDFIFVGGSNFVVADLLEYLEHTKHLSTPQ